MARNYTPAFTEAVAPDSVPSVRFSELGLSEGMQATLELIGYNDPTPIQTMTLPVALSGRDVIGQAQTGSGKTAAFAIPILERLDRSRTDVQALVMCPTRELAAQVQAEFERLAQGSGFGVLTVVGGDPIHRQLEGLKLKPAVVVGTPGRILDHLQRRTLSLRSIRFAVLDEADRMLDMGFAPDVERILQQTPKERQTLLFSATVPGWIHRLVERHMRDPQTISVSGQAELVDTVSQWCIECSWADKVDALSLLLDSPRVTCGLIFTATKRNADMLHTVLLGTGYDVTVLHGDLSQHDRDLALKRFRDSKVRFLIATDVAARGIDIDDISHVINYDVPASPEDYIHRVGRTARAGRDGVALTLITPIEILKIRDIEKHTRRAIERHTLEDLRQLAGTVTTVVG
ncbi:MAG: DEAD/DEAH box helicase [Candidatus Dormibacteria bacterium]